MYFPLGKMDLNDVNVYRFPYTLLGICVGCNGGGNLGPTKLLDRAYAILITDIAIQEHSQNRLFFNVNWSSRI